MIGSSSGEGMVCISYPELIRAGPDVLRMAGLHLAQADEAVELFAATEALLGGSLEFLARHRDAIRMRTRPRLVSRGPYAAEIDLGGATLLEWGIRVFQYGRSEAASSSTSDAPCEHTIRVRRALGAVFVPYLVLDAARHGYAVRARYEPGDRADGQNEVLTVAGDAPVGGATAEVSLRTSIGTERTVEGPSSSWARRARDAGPGDLVFTCRREPAWIGDRHQSGTFLDRAAQQADTRWASELRRALSDGMLADVRYFSTFLELAARIRVPASERSAKQAG